MATCAAREANKRGGGGAPATHKHTLIQKTSPPPPLLITHTQHTKIQYNMNNKKKRFGNYWRAPAP